MVSIWQDQESWANQTPSFRKMYIKIMNSARHQWLTPIIPVSQEAEIRRIAIGG
jgi:hypothetical protein